MQHRQLSDPFTPAEVDDAVAALAAGQVVVLPTETVYGFAADPRRPAAVAAIAALKGRPEAQPFTHHLATKASLPDFAVPPPWRLQRFLDRVWPGPWTIVLPAIDGQGTCGLRVPAQPFTQAVIAATGPSLYLTSVNRAGAPPMTDPAAITAAFTGEAAIAALFDAGPSPIGEASAVLRLTGPELEVLREGLLSHEEILWAAAAKVVFVCTGNTCRSPMAEHLARAMLAEQLRIAPAGLLAHGLAIFSAGTGTMDGLPAAENSLLATAEAGLGLDLGAHRSRRLTAGQIAGCDLIYCLAEPHREELLAQVPEAAARVRLLRPDDRGIADPYGGPVELYRRALHEIRASLVARLPEILALLA